MRVAFVLVAGLVALAGCGSSSRYAGLSRKEAVTAARRAVEARLDPSKRSYFETSIWNVAADHAADPARRPVWLVGIWNGQTNTGRCALVAKRSGSTFTRLIPCGLYPRFGK